MSKCLFDSMFIWSGNADELLDRGQFSPPLPVHEPLQTSQLLTNLLMLDWSDMLEPQRLQSTASLARPNTVIEKTWASAQPIKHRQLQAARSNPIVTGQSWSVLFWKWYITRRSHASAGLLDPSDSMSELRLFFFSSLCKFDSLLPSISQYCMQTIRSLLIYLCIVIDTALLQTYSNRYKCSWWH